MTTTETTIEGWSEHEIGGFDATPTDIEGIVHLRSPNDGTEQYAVRFTLYIDADSLEQASSRAMALRHAFANGDDYHDQRGYQGDFYWHLHDHDGC